MTEVKSKLSYAEEALLGVLNEEISDTSTSMVPDTPLPLTQMLHRRLNDVEHSGEVRHAELENAVEMCEKFDDKLHDVSYRLDEIARDIESYCQLPCATAVDAQQHISRQKVSC